MPTIQKLESAIINSSLLDNTRQYLVGDLKRPQTLPHLYSNQIEVGITSYKAATIEQPHSHTHAFEYQYMISGYTAYLDLDTKEKYFFKKGDFFIIEPGVRYAQKSKMNTEILFFKIPPGNDKLPIESTEEVSSWLKKTLRSIRIDYFDDPQAPTPNSICPAAAVALFDSEKKILLLRRRDNDKWTMPGGTLEFGESLTDCAKRETKEETGFTANITHLIGTYTDPRIIVAYTDGEVRQEFTFLYAGEIVGGKLCIDDESTEAGWFNMEEIVDLPLAESKKRRLLDVISYQEDMTVKLR